MIIFLYGEDEFRSARKLAEIKNKFLQNYKEGGTLFVFDFSESMVKTDEMAMKLSSGGLFSSKKLAIVKGLLQNKAVAEDENVLKLLGRIKKGELEGVTVLFHEREKIDKKKKLAKFILANSKSQEFKFLDGAKLTVWIRAEVEKIGGGSVKISSGAVSKLAAFVGEENLYLLEQEIKKLVSYRNNGEIDEADVDLLVRSKISTDIFRTVDALSAGEKRTAAKLLHNHLSSGEDPFYLLSMYFFQFRNLVKTKPFEEKHATLQEVAARLKMHPFVARKSMEQAKRFTFGKLKGLYQELCDIDYRVKTGKADIVLALDKFVAGV